MTHATQNTGDETMSSAKQFRAELDERSDVVATALLQDSSNRLSLIAIHELDGTFATVHWQRSGGGWGDVQIKNCKGGPFFSAAEAAMNAVNRMLDHPKLYSPPIDGTRHGDWNRRS